MRLNPASVESSRTPRSPGDRWLFAALLALLVWLPLPAGSRSGSAVAFLCVAATALAGCWLVLLQLRRIDPVVLPRAARFSLAIWGLWLAWLVMQILPLPTALLAVLSPSAHAIHEALRPLGAEPYSTLSILPGASLDNLILSASYFCLFGLVLGTTARNRPRQRLLLGTLVLSGLGQALFGIVMTLSGWEYGFLERKIHGLGVATGTFINRNHLAGYLELTLSAGIALVLADLRPAAPRNWREILTGLIDLALSRRMRVRVVLAVMVVALVLTRSRMGNAAFFVALAVCGNVYVFLRHKRYFARSLIFFLSLFLVDLLILSEQFGLQQLAERIEATDMQTERRTLVLRELEPVIGEYWLTGSGAGTFAAAYSPHRSAQISEYYDHAHNDHAEFLIETGVPGYALILLLAAVTLIHGVRIMLRRHEPMACALGFAGVTAVVTLGIHGLADFNLRVPAVAATLVALMALSLSCSAVPASVRNPPTGGADPADDRPGAPQPAD